MAASDVVEELDPRDCVLLERTEHGAGQKGDLRLMAKWRSQFSSVVSSHVPDSKIAALLTSG